MKNLGIIQEIQAIDYDDPNDNTRYEGYRVRTDKNEYMILIEYGQQCCESYGYLSSEDDFSKFIGTKLLDVTLTDTGLSTKTLEEFKYIGYSEPVDYEFVTFITNKGNFQLVVYNAHNGYYGHSIMFIENGKEIISEIL